VRIALVHDWLTGMRGGERVLEALCELYPEADLFTLIHAKNSVSPKIEDRRIVESFIARLPGVRRFYRYFLPIFPFAVERFDLREYDLVISSSHCVAKGVIPGPDACHISYIHTPMRYVWDMFDEYFGIKRAGILTCLIMRPIADWLRKWDAASSYRVNFFIANSKHVQMRIDKFYKRTSSVIYPPVNISRFSLSETIEDFDLVVSALTPYKRIDLAVEAAKITGRRLLVVGTGPLAKELQSIAWRNTEFLGWLPDSEVAKLMARCRLFIFPGVEDFGIAPLEAQAAGRPVVAFKQGGALETVEGSDVGQTPDRSRSTGVFFFKQTPESLAEAIQFAESSIEYFDPQVLRANAARFDISVFKQSMTNHVNEALERHQYK